MRDILALLPVDWEKCVLENGEQLSGYKLENIEKSTYIQSEYQCSVFEHLFCVSECQYSVSK